MDITQLSGVSSDYLNTFAKKEALVPGDDDSFSAVLSTAMKSVDETNDLQCYICFRLCNQQIMWIFGFPKCEPYFFRLRSILQVIGCSAG